MSFSVYGLDLFVQYHQTLKVHTINACGTNYSFYYFNEKAFEECDFHPLLASLTVLLGWE